MSNSNTQLLLSKKVVPPARFHALKRSPEGTFLIGAGIAHGITRGASFDIYATPNTTSKPIGSLVAVRSHASSAILSWSASSDVRPTIPPGAWVRQTGLGAGVPIAIIFRDSFPDLFKLIVDRVEEDNECEVIIVESEFAELVVMAEEERAVFDLTDERCLQNGLRQLLNSVPLDIDSIYPILRHAADFFRALRCPKNSLDLLQYITVEARELSSEDQDWHLYGPSLSPIGDNLNVDGVIQIPVEDRVEAQYGFKIVSTFNRSLYAWLFIFNVSDLSINTIFQPYTIMGKADPSLHPKTGELTVGYGSDGSMPQSFYLPPDMDIDVSYLKLYLTSEYVDLSHLEQTSAFEGGRHSYSNPPMPRLLDAIIIPVIQKRKTGPQ